MNSWNPYRLVTLFVAVVALVVGLAVVPAQAHCKGKHTGDHPHCTGGPDDNESGEHPRATSGFRDIDGASQDDIQCDLVPIGMNPDDCYEPAKHMKSELGGQTQLNPPGYELVIHKQSNRAVIVNLCNATATDFECTNFVGSNTDCRDELTALFGGNCILNLKNASLRPYDFPAPDIYTLMDGASTDMGLRLGVSSGIRGNFVLEFAATVASSAPSPQPGICGVSCGLGPGDPIEDSDGPPTAANDVSVTAFDNVSGDGENDQWQVDGVNVRGLMCLAGKPEVCIGFTEPMNFQMNVKRQ